MSDFLRPFSSSHRCHQIELQNCILPEKPSLKREKKLRAEYQIPSKHEFVWIERFSKEDSSPDNCCDIELSAFYNLILEYLGPEDTYEPILDNASVQKLRFKTKFSFKEY